MGLDPVSVGAIVAVAGAATSAGASVYGAHQQRKAAKSAARAAEKAANTPVTVSSGNEAAETTSTEATVGKNTASKAKRRLTVEDFAVRFSGEGLRKTLN